MDGQETFPGMEAHPDTYVYIGARQSFIKIGITTNPARRARQLGITLLHVQPGGPLDEKALHKRFASARIDREWFMPTPALLAFVTHQGATDPLAA